MHVLITGGTGFIGSRLALRCVERGDSVTVLGQVNTRAEKDNKDSLENAGANVIVGSITDRDSVSQATTGVDHVFHLAACQHEANVPERRFWDVNVTGTQVVLQESVAAGVKRFVQGSTIGVYGPSHAGPIDESAPLRPNTVYGITKLEAEKIVLNYKEKLGVVITRISETYGPGDLRLLKLFKAIRSRMFFIIGQGDNCHQLIYIDDLIRALLASAMETRAEGHTLVLPGREALTTTEIATIIATHFGVKAPRLRLPLMPFLVTAALLEGTLGRLGVQPPLHRRRLDFFRKSFRFSNEKSRRLLGVMPETTFRTGMEQTAQWYEAKGYI